MYVHFPLPNESERKEIWNRTVPLEIQYEANKDIPSIVSKYEVAGSNILNIVKYAYSSMLGKKSKIIKLDDVIEGIKIEYEKEGRVFNS